jgi:Protein of unknown function (DUF3592)
MIGDALTATPLQALAAGFTDLGAAAAVLVVGGGVADSGVQPDGAVVAADHLQCSAEIVGVVDQGQEGLGPDSNERSFYPVLQFVTSSGQAVRFQADEGRDPSAYRVGDWVRVLYDSRRPAAGSA